jgi:hypothetical protein
LGKISDDETLRAACEHEYQELMGDKPLSPASVPGILAEPAIHEFN